MTEIPEHLRKRAEEARKKAAAKKAGGAAEGAGAAGAGGGGGAPKSEAASRSPHLLERVAAAKARASGGGGDAGGSGGGGGTATAVATRRAAAAAAARGHRARGSHPAPADGRQVGLDPGRQGHAAGQGPRLAPPARHRVRRRAGLHAFLLIFRCSSTPLLELANVNETPNPSKAPWYFLGLQELLTMFHPMVAGVTLPGIGLIGLILAPYTDRNPSNKPEDRKFAISLFTIFLMAWAVLVLIGSFFRGPGQNFVFPWKDGLFFEL